MAPRRVVLVVAVCVAVFGVPVVPELVPSQLNSSSHPTTAAIATGHSLQDATTAQSAKMSLFHKVLNAAKDLVSPFWGDSSNTTVTPAASAPSGTTVADHLSARTPGHVQFLQGGHSIKSAKINFTLRILNEDFSVMAEPPTYTPGSPIRVEAKVESSAGVSPRIYVDECYGSHAEHLSHSRRIYVIVNNHGCLHGGKSGDVAVWCRPEDSALQFATPAFMLADEPEEKIYIHCLLTAWGQESLTSLGKKSCYYNSTSFSWQNLEDPSQNLKCSCCDSHCPADSAPPGELRERCRTLKKLLLVGVAFVGSCLVGALFVGGLLALALALFRSYQRSKGQRLLRKRKEYPYQTELQSVVNALVTAEEMQKAERESSIDYNLNTDASEKE
ncbi:uncharacterized protein LOC128824914 isoform X2 [Malaclemys terrapin pileata]|uniref:uncharacterized protein LOC128824914 isoform X2 n=1 Tax=Malaclemys terrapin pileata TaxID=2991368 RepID=UPI0023A89E93|nr:uncharacterized protein LOC128824914 isoform X2 [Malaclemys terrapin pileata]